MGVDRCLLSVAKISGPGLVVSIDIGLSSVTMLRWRGASFSPGSLAYLLVRFSWAAV